MTPLASRLLGIATAAVREGARVVFISGPQGVGKSTAMGALTEGIPGSVALGLDDFYLTRVDRQALARDGHTLFATRGPPGTHDIPLLTDTLTRLTEAGPDHRIRIPLFDKAADDRLPPEDWAVSQGAPRVIFLEGWLLGVAADPAAAEAPPLNAIEARDRNGRWRAWQEAQLAGPYARLWDMADAFLYIDAPGFAAVHDWRIEQEETTRGLAPGTLDKGRRDWVAGFILHYQRLTERLLAGHRRPGEAIAVDRFRQPL
jgi:D-glycerate 3-kinase